MKISKLARREAKLLFRACFADGSLDEGRVRSAVSQVLTARPRGYLAVLSHFQRLLKLYLQRRAARVESAIALGGDQQSAVQSTLTRLYGPGLSRSFTVNPALIGGLRVQVGSDVFDGSIRTRLRELEARF
ncbi:MAG: F0F1 ATP synthase subunit delta [Verrucomicrobia bacterium]|nr:F0F1 ATP synthase subunit delta [Verrucomicrobiota bacterium]